MRFSHHPLSSVVIAAATLLSLLPLAPMVRGSGHLLEAGFVVAASAAVGVGLTLLRSPRLLVVLAQALAVAGVVAWRGLGLASAAADPLAALAALTADGVTAIRTGAAPVEPVPGIVWLIVVLTALLVVALELLVTALEQPAWAIAPLALVYGVAAITVDTDLSFWYLLPVVAGYVAVLLSATGVAESATGRASRPGAYLASRLQVAVAFGAAALALALVVAPLLPLGDKQPWNSGPDGPIQLSDPTVRLEQDLKRPADSEVLTYRTSDGRPAYLRTVALPELTPSGARLLPMRLSTFGLSQAHTFPGDEVEVMVSMAGVPSEYLPVPFAVDAIDAAGEWSFDPDTLSVVASGPDRLEQTIDLDYTVISTMPSPSREEIEAAGAGSGVLAATSEVPEGLDSRVTAMTAEVVAGANSAGAKALAIQEYLRSGAFEYSLEAPASTGTDAISSFLLDDRSGYCIHFAAAMIAMARIEGIPARMAVGFTPGELLEDGSYRVTAHDAHAWPELFLDDLGWVPFEPTPAFDGPPEYTDPAEQPTGSASPSPTPTTSASLEPPTVEPTAAPTPTLRPTAPGQDTDVSVAGWVVAGLSLLVLLALPALIRIALRVWRLRPGQARRTAAAAAWAEVEALFVDVGRDLPDGSPGPVAAAMAADLPQRAAATLREIAHTVEVSQFSRTGTDVDRLPAQVRALRAALLRDATPAVRARALLGPPSLLLAARRVDLGA